MFEIKITEMNAAVMVAFAALFKELAQIAVFKDAGGYQEYAECKDAASTLAKAVIENSTYGKLSKLAAEDNPAMGADTVVHIPDNGDAASVFGAHVLEATVPTSDATVVFGGTSVELDANGLPWDGRIHASTQTKTAKNVWKARKGADPGLVAAITAELRQAMAVPSNFIPLNTAPPPPPPPPPADTTVNMGVQTVQAQPQIVQSPVSQTAPPTNFVELSKWCTANAIPGPSITAACQLHGLAGLGLTATRPDLVPAIFASLVASR